jgi:hypothetical protein
VIGQSVDGDVRVVAQVSGEYPERTRTAPTRVAVGTAVRTGATVEVADGVLACAVVVDSASARVAEGANVGVDDGRAVTIAVGVVPGNAVEARPTVAVTEGITVASTSDVVAVVGGVVADGVTESAIAWAGVTEAPVNVTSTANTTRCHHARRKVTRSHRPAGVRIAVP